MGPLDGADGLRGLFNGAFGGFGEAFLGRSDHFNDFLRHQFLLGK
jgi:hypothetical protein